MSAAEVEVCLLSPAMYCSESVEEGDRYSAEVGWGPDCAHCSEVTDGKGRLLSKKKRMHFIEVLLLIL
jgi:hypothetical protein